MGLQRVGHDWATNTTMWACRKALMLPICMLSYLNLCHRVLHTHRCAVLCSVMSDSGWAQGPEPARLLCPWDSPGKNTAVVAVPASRGSSPPRSWIHGSCISCTAGGFFTAEPLGASLHTRVSHAKATGLSKASTMWLLSPASFLCQKKIHLSTHYTILPSFTVRQENLKPIAYLFFWYVRNCSLFYTVNHQNV